MAISEYIKNLKKMQRRLSDPDWVSKPAGGFLRDWREDLKAEAIDRAPKWRGGIIRSLQSNQDTARFPLYARVFSDAPQARWSEYGTGLLSEDPLSARNRYFPPVQGVADWADDHGIDPYLVSRGIYERGGTPPTHFFSDAERAADARFNQKLSRFGKEIEYQAEKG